MTTALLIAAGGALGTLLRYGVGVGLAPWLGSGFPYGTLAVNLLGSLLLVTLMETAPELRLLGVELRLLVGTGVLGGFTTYSAFNLETLRMVQQGQVGRAGLYLSATLIGCLVAGWLGLSLGRALRG
jgi:CrcB protein